MNKNEFLVELQAAYADLTGLLASLSEAQWLEPNVYEGLSVKDVVAHIAAWESLAVDWVAASRRGTLPVRFAPGYEIDPGIETEPVMDALNEHFFLLHRKETLVSVRANFEDTHQQMTALVEAMPEEELTQPGQFEWRPDKPMWPVLASNSFEHYREHAALIQAWLANQ